MNFTGERMPASQDQIFTEVSTIGDLLLRAAATAPDRAAIVMPGYRATYAELRDGAVAFARGLAGIGLRPGQNVGLFLPNSAGYIEALFGIALLGCVAVPLNTRHKAAELAFIIKNADLVAIVTSGSGSDYVDLPSILAEALPSLNPSEAPRHRPLSLPEAPLLTHIINIDGGDRHGFLSGDSLRAIAATVPPDIVEQARRGVCTRNTGLIIYTSGTTAHPKGCMLSHEAVTRGPVERARYRLSSGDHNVTWGAGPLFHIGSLAPFIGSVGVAGTYLTDVYFDAGRAIALMRQEGVTLAWPWFSAIVQAIIDHPSFDSAAFPDLRYLFMIAPATLVDRVQELLPQTEILQACGMTETAGIFALSEPDETPLSRSTTQGKAAPGIEVRIIEPSTGRDLPPGEMGEIWVRGYNVMSGYYHDQEQTSAALTEDGWLRTGDLYSRSRDNSLVFSGRLKDMLKVGGENVATMEVEAFLCSHPDVKLAEIVGMPDPRLDEVPAAFVELRAGSTVTPDGLIAFCKGRIASYKIPRLVVIMSADEWPMSTTKIDKRALRDRVRSMERLAS